MTVADRLSWLESVGGVRITHVRTPNFTPHPIRTLESIGGIVIHTAEIAEVSTAAESLGQWLGGPERPPASWHFAVDCDSATQSVPLDRTAWHVQAPNKWTIGIELCGRARQTPAEWADEYSEAVLCNAAAICAHLCDIYGLPIRRATHADIVEAHAFNSGSNPALKIGLFGHVDANQALGVKGGHWDPGPHFPWPRFLEMIGDTHA